MAKKYMSLERLQEYDALIKQEIASSVSDKASSSHTHDDRYYTETEIDSKIETVNTSISNITEGTTKVAKATHSDTAGSATSATDSEKLGGQSPSYYAKASDIPTGSLADKDIVSESDLDAALAEKVNAAAEGNHSHSNKTVLDGITAAKVSNWDSAEQNAKTYADNAANAVKNDLLNGAGGAYDTLKELGDLIDTNKDAIDALEEIAAGKADKNHSHAIADVSGLQNALDAKDTAIEAVRTDVSNMSAVVLSEAQKGIDAVQTNLDALEDVVDGKANASHSHAISEVTNLQTALDTLEGAIADKADSSHSHTITASASDDDVVILTGTSGSNKVTYSASHANSGVTAGTYKSVTVNAQGHVTAGSNPTTLAGYGITDAASKTHTHAISDITNLQTTLNNASSAIGANTSSIDAHTERIESLETKVGDGFEEITSAEIQALFA